MRRARQHPGGGGGAAHVGAGQPRRGGHHPGGARPPRSSSRRAGGRCRPSRSTRCPPGWPASSRSGEPSPRSPGSSSSTSRPPASASRRPTTSLELLETLAAGRPRDPPRGARRRAGDAGVLADPRPGLRAHHRRGHAEGDPAGSPRPGGLPRHRRGVTGRSGGRLRGRARAAGGRPVLMTTMWFRGPSPHGCQTLVFTVPPLTGRPSAVALGDGVGLWVVEDESGLVHRLDPSDGRASGTPHAGIARSSLVGRRRRRGVGGRPPRDGHPHRHGDRCGHRSTAAGGRHDRRRRGGRHAGVDRRHRGGHGAGHRCRVRHRGSRDHRSGWCCAPRGDR